MDAKKENFEFEFCEKCKCYKEVCDEDTENMEKKHKDTMHKKYNKYKYCPITKRLREITKRNKEKQIEIAQFLGITVKQLYRYSSGEANLYKKIDEFDFWKRKKFNDIVGCGIEELECPHMKKPKIVNNYCFNAPDLTGFYDSLFNCKQMDECAIIFIQTVYNSSMEYYEDTFLDSEDVMEKIDDKVKESKEMLIKQFNRFLEKCEKNIIEKYCNKNSVNRYKLK